MKFVVPIFAFNGKDWHGTRRHSLTSSLDIERSALTPYREHTCVAGTIWLLLTFTSVNTGIEHGECEVKPNMISLLRLAPLFIEGGLTWMAPDAQTIGRGVLQVKGGTRQGLLAPVTDFEVGHHMWFRMVVGRPRE